MPPPMAQVGQRRNSFLPTISISKRLLDLENNDDVTDKGNNPFSLPGLTERILIKGERQREAAKLEELKYKLF
jgi:hypothetical protein